MCFSAPASFIASGGLTAIGAASLVVAKKEDKLLAAVPFMFGIQQGLEGIQWLYIDHGSTSLFAGYGFLVFALIVWPVYVPLFVYVLDKKRRSLLRWFLGIGIAIAIYYTLELALARSLSIDQVCSSVHYYFTYPYGKIAFPLYFLAVFGSLLVSSKPFFRWFSIIIASLTLVSWYFYVITFISVWCFFAAIVSTLFFGYILSNNKIKSIT